jgi:uncharacterized protein (TIGR04255 family)
MNDETIKLKNPPIVEAILDIECDSPVGQKLSDLKEPSQKSFMANYPKLREQLLQELKIQTKPDGTPDHSCRYGVAAYQYLQEDEKQLVQVRAQGFTFNRLSPYTTLDDYLPEIERCWRLYVDLASPVQIRKIRLRYINRILLPLVEGSVDLDQYLEIGPHLPDEEKLKFVGFINQHSAVEIATGHQVNTVLATQNPETGNLPVIFDNSAATIESGSPDDWSWIAGKIMALRQLKNEVFRRTLTDKCLNLFQ